MISGDGAAAQGCETDIAAAARASQAIASARRTRLERDLASARSGFAQHQRRARGRIDLGAVMHLENLDIKTFVERLGHSLHHRCEQIDSQTHVARLDHDGARGDALDYSIVGRRQPGGADDMNEAAFGGDGDVGDGGAGHGEVENAVRIRRHRPEIGRQQHAIGRKARKHAGILAQKLRAGRFQRTGEHRAPGVGNDACQRPAHAAAGSGNDQAHIRHFRPRPTRALTPAV